MARAGGLATAAAGAAPKPATSGVTATPSPPGAGLPRESKKVLAVYYVGGVSFMEIAALRFLSESRDCTYTSCFCRFKAPFLHPFKVQVIHCSLVHPLLFDIFLVLSIVITSIFSSIPHRRVHNETHQRCAPCCLFQHYRRSKLALTSSCCPPSQETR